MGSDGHGLSRIMDGNDGLYCGREHRCHVGLHRIERAHETWYDDATLGLNKRPRQGSKRYDGFVPGDTVTVVGTVVTGQEGNALAAQTIFGRAL